MSKISGWKKSLYTVLLYVCALYGAAGIIPRGFNYVASGKVFKDGAIFIASNFKEAQKEPLKKQE